MEKSQIDSLIEIENFSKQISNNLIQYSFQTTCMHLDVIKGILKNKNISFEEIDYETILSFYKEEILKTK